MLLEEVFIYSIQHNIEIKYCAYLNLASFSYMVSNSANTVPITIIVHPEVYAKLTDDTNEEWYAVNTLAKERQISFGTEEQTATLDLTDRTVRVTSSEIVAPSGCYLTQAEDLPIDQRLFCTRKILLSADDADNWRLATDNERAEYEEYIKQIENEAYDRRTEN